MIKLFVKFTFKIMKNNFFVSTVGNDVLTQSYQGCANKAQYCIITCAHQLKNRALRRMSFLVFGPIQNDGFKILAGTCK